MARKSLPLSKVYGLLEPGPVVLLTTASNQQPNVMTMQMVARYSLFVLEVVKAWIDPAVESPRTLHHLGHGRFMVAGETIKLRSKMK